MSTAPPMPDWSPQDGPWCLKQWVPFNTPDPSVDCCLLALGHDGNCRGVYGTPHNHDFSLCVGQLQNATATDPSEGDPR